MKLTVTLPLLLAAVLFAGCKSPDEQIYGKPPAKNAPAPVSPKTTATAPQPIVTPETSLTATVVSYNSVGRFVVLNFPMNQMPKQDQTLFVYRNGLKVAQLKVTGPQRDTHIVADLVSGDVRPNDVVRDQ
jgi:DMSO/TMAO reductase YedYZ molybdopterin-dependent catalytic subunit